MVQPDTARRVPAGWGRDPCVLRLLDHGPDQRECHWGKAGRGLVDRLTYQLPVQTLLIQRNGPGLRCVLRKARGWENSPLRIHLNTKGLQKIIAKVLQLWHSVVAILKGGKAVNRFSEIGVNFQVI